MACDVQTVVKIGWYHNKGRLGFQFQFHCRMLSLKIFHVIFGSHEDENRNFSNSHKHCCQKPAQYMFLYQNVNWFWIFMIEKSKFKIIAYSLAECDQNRQNMRNQVVMLNGTLRKSRLTNISNFHYHITFMFVIQFRDRKALKTFNISQIGRLSYLEAMSFP